MNFFGGRGKLATKLRAFCQAHIIFLCLAVIFGGYLVYTIPLLWGYDETQHFSRAYQVGTGQFVAERLSDHEYGGHLPTNLVDLSRKAELDLQDNKGGPFYLRSDVDQPSLYTHDAAVGFSKQKQRLIFNGSAVYSPAAYLPAAATVRVATLAHLSMRTTILLARAAMLLSYIVIVAAGLYLLRNSAAKYIIFVIGLLPMSIAQAAVVSADVLASALGLFLAAGYIHAWTSVFRVSKRIYYVLAVAVVLLPLVKLNYIFLCLPFLLLKPPFVLPKLEPFRRYLPFAYLAILLIPVIVWTLTAKGMIGQVATAIPNLHNQVNAHAQLVGLLTHPLSFLIVCAATLARHGDEYVYGLTSSMGWNYAQLPLVNTIIISILVFCATIQAGFAARGRGRFNLVLLAAGTLTVLSIFTALYLTFTPVGHGAIEGVQSRYFIPAIPFILYGLARFVPTPAKLNHTRSLAIYSMVIFVMLATSCAWYTLATY